MKSRLLIGLVAAMALAMVGFACGGGDTEQAAPAAAAAAEPAAPAAAAAPAPTAVAVTKAAPEEEMKALPTVKIAHFTFMTGVATALGDDANFAAKLAAKEANDAGGILGGRKVSLKFYDQGYSGETVVASAKKALADGVVAVVGDMDATTCVPLMFELKEKGEFPLAVTSCGSERIILEGYHGAVHLASPAVAAQNEYNMVSNNTRFLMSQGDKIVMVSNDSEYCRNAETELKRTIGVEGEAGDALIDSIFFPFGASDARIEVTKAVAEEPDTMYFCQWGKELVVSSIKTARDLGFEGPMLVTIYDQPESDQLFEVGGAKYTDNTYGVAPWAPDPSIPENQAFVDGFQEISGGKGNISFLAEHSYTAMKLMIQAIDLAGSTDPDAIKDALYNVHFVTPDGAALQFDSRGMRKSPTSGLIARGEDGKMFVAQKLPIIWPEE